jgi:PAS domain S-box-containing protein
MAAEWRFLITLNERLRPFRDPVEIQTAAVRMIGEHLDANRVHYVRIDDGEFVISRAFAPAAPPVADRGQVATFGQAIISTCGQGETMVVDNVDTDARFTGAERAQLGAIQAAAFVVVPLIKESRWVAAFVVHTATPRAWTPDQIVLIELTAERTWSAGERGHAEAGLLANEERLEFLLRLNDALRPLSDAGDIQQTAARLLGQHLGTTRAGYATFTGGEYSIYREYANGVPPLAGERPAIAIGEMLRAALRRGETIVVADVETDARLADDDRATLRKQQIAAFIGAALFKDGRMVAAFGTNHVEPRAWTATEVALVRDVAERTWDAVERARAEAGLREQEERLRLALEASSGGSWTWNAVTNEVHWDEQFRALYGFGADEPASTDSWIPRVHEDDRPRLVATLNEVLTSKTMESWENTFRIVRPNGTITWIQSRGRIRRDAEGKITRLDGLDLDFNQHRRAEEALQAQREEEHDRTLRTLLETATQGIVSLGEDGLIVTANQAFAEMFGWTVEELIGQPIERLIPAFGDGRERRGGLRFIGTNRDGFGFPIEVSVNNVATPAGRRAFAFVTDITARQLAASALEERTAELEHRTKQLSRMASDLTLAEQHAREQIAKTLHDGLQQLLVIALMNLELHVKRDAESGAAPSELLSEARNQLEEAIAAARSLNFELFPPVLQLAGLPAALTWLANWTHDKHKLPVEVIVDPRADSGRKDVRTLLFESVRELLFNAVKHAQADRVKLELALAGDDQLCITVSDEGIGFEPAALDQRSNNGQVGWGLFSIRERLTLLGGHVEIDSAAGTGTRVRLIAPLVDAPRDVETGALRIVIADDHPKVRGALRDMLHERPQLSVVGEASNGLEAIARAHALRPDVVLMDIAMPQMDGIAATKRLRAELPDITVFGLSAQPRSAVADAIEQAGARGFFVKGLDTQRLMQQLLVIHASRSGRNAATP